MLAPSRFYRAVRATADTKTPEEPDASHRCRNWLYGRSVEHLDRQAGDRLLAGVLWEDHGLVFASAIGTPLDRHNVLREFRRITQAAGLGTDWVPREMRHTFVSLLSSNGTVLEDIAEPGRAQGHGHDPSRSTGRSSCPNCDAVAEVMDRLFS